MVHIRTADKYRDDVAQASKLEIEITKNNIKQAAIVARINAQKQRILERQLKEVPGMMGLNLID